jgi:hypothetical protein
MPQKVLDFLRHKKIDYLQTYIFRRYLAYLNQVIFIRAGLNLEMRRKQHRL